MPILGTHKALLTLVALSSGFLRGCVLRYKALIGWVVARPADKIAMYTQIY
jgi:hypothetical protein